MNIEAVIDYWGPGVATFDPEKVLWRLKEHFPEAEIDTADRAELEVASLDAFVEQQQFEPQTKDTMRRQIRGKSRRNGPVYQFNLTDGGVLIEGRSSRYCVTFRSDQDIEGELRRRIVGFLESLNLGRLVIR